MDDHGDDAKIALDRVGSSKSSQDLETASWKEKEIEFLRLTIRELLLQICNDDQLPIECKFNNNTRLGVPSNIEFNPDSFSCHDDELSHLQSVLTPSQRELPIPTSHYSPLSNCSKSEPSDGLLSVQSIPMLPDVPLENTSSDVDAVKNEAPDELRRQMETLQLVLLHSRQDHSQKS